MSVFISTARQAYSAPCQTCQALHPTIVITALRANLSRTMDNAAMEARAGIEPAYKDLQSSASPLRQRAKPYVI